MSTDHLSGPLRQLLQLTEHVRNSHPNQYHYHMGFTWPAALPEPELFQELRGRGIHLEIISQKGRLDFSLVRKIQKLIAVHKIDLLQSHGYKPSILAFLLKRKLGLPWVAFLHGRTAENLKVRCYFKMEKLVVRKADVVVTVSERMRREMLDFGFSPSQVRTLRNAINPDAFQTNIPEHDADRLRKLHVGRNGGPVLGIVGRMSPEKGHVWFMDAFQEVLQQVPDAILLLIGSGQEERKLKQMCAARGLNGRVHFVGFQSEISPWYSLLDLVVMPSLSEGLPNTAMEAMLFGRPVVATDVGGVPEVVEHGVTGRLVPVREPRSMADAIIAYLADPAMRATHGANGRTKVLREFSPHVQADSLIKIYENVLSGALDKNPDARSTSS